MNREEHSQFIALKEKLHETERKYREAVDSAAKWEELATKNYYAYRDSLEERSRYLNALVDIKNMPVTYEGEKIFGQIAKSALTPDPT